MLFLNFGFFEVLRSVFGSTLVTNRAVETTGIRSVCHSCAVTFAV
jgi:hypothetical protein